MSSGLEILHNAGIPQNEGKTGLFQLPADELIKILRGKELQCPPSEGIVSEFRSIQFGRLIVGLPSQMGNRLVNLTYGDVVVVDINLDGDLHGALVKQQFGIVTGQTRDRWNTSGNNPRSCILLRNAKYYNPWQERWERVVTTGDGKTFGQHESDYVNFLGLTAGHKAHITTTDNPNVLQLVFDVPQSIMSSSAELPEIR